MPNAQHSMDAGVAPYLGLQSSTILQLHVLVIRGHLVIEQSGWLFVYIGRRRMRKLVQDGVRRMRGIQQGPLLDVDRIELAVGQSWSAYSVEKNKEREN